MSFECEYCGSVLKTTRGLEKHRCQRKALIEETGEISLVRAYTLFDFWFRYNGLAKKSKTIEQFMKSPYFNLFIGFEKHVAASRVHSREFLKWLVDTRVNSRDWTKESVLAAFSSFYSKNCEAVPSMTKTLENIAVWCDQHGIDSGDFFRYIGPGEAIQWMRNGKLSPWVVLVSEKSMQMFERMSKEQIDFSGELMDLDHWEARFRSSPSETDVVKKSLEGMGL